MRGGGDKRPESQKVELGGSEASSVGYETVMREAVRREDAANGGENVSWLFSVESIVSIGAPCFGVSFQFCYIEKMSSDNQSRKSA